MSAGRPSSPRQAGAQRLGTRRFDGLRSGRFPSTAHRLLGGAALLFGAWAVFQLGRLPIIAGDTDLWYHLAHGRNILETGTLPTGSHFSFLEPERPFTDYYWLFQVGVARVFESSGYAGVAALRTGLFGLFLVALGGVLLGRGRQTESRPFEALLVGFLAFAVSVPLHLDRFDLVRPHLVTYTMMAGFLWLLERSARPPSTTASHSTRWSATPTLLPLLLPPLAVVWVNCHGVEYPVMLALVAAYAADLPFDHGLDPRRWSRSVQLRATALVAAAGAVLATPHGLDLLAVPFRSTDLAASYIAELRTPTLAERLLLPTGLEGRLTDRLANLLALAAVVAVLLRVAVLARPRPSSQPGARSDATDPGARWATVPLRPRHLLVFVGLFLGLRAVRFSHEMALFAIPALLDLPWRHLRAPRFELTERRATALALVALVAAMPALAWVDRLSEEATGDRPLATSRLPLGSTAWLLDELDTLDDGRLLHAPGPGGWFYRALVPPLRITMDMEVPFLFTDEDMVQVTTAFREAPALHDFLERYRPDAVAAPLSVPEARRTLAPFPDLIPVSVDDTTALFVDRRRHPDLAARFGLEAIDPFALETAALVRAAPAERREIHRELEALAAREPRVRRVQLALATLAQLDGRARDAFEAADRARRAGGDPTPALELQAEALKSLGRCRDALPLYARVQALQERRRERMAGATATATASSAVPPRARSAAVLGEVQCRLELGDTLGAYRTLDAAVGDRVASTDARTLLQLGQLAAAVGEVERAVILWRLARWTHDDPGLRAAIDRALSTLGLESVGAASPDAAAARAPVD